MLVARARQNGGAGHAVEDEVRPVQAKARPLRLALIGNEHVVIICIPPATPAQVPLQPEYGGLVKGDQARLAELGRANDQPLSRKIRAPQAQCLGDAQPACREQGD
jgi:hypothetical protein